jgi:transcriptional regulator with XRE-family HTH domain
VPTPLGIKIRQLRKEQGLSLDQLADRAETSKSYLWELENRETANPTMDKVSKIAEKLGVTAEFLLNDEQVAHSAEDADKAFFRKYQKLSAPTKKKIQDILNVIRENGADDK